MRCKIECLKETQWCVCVCEGGETWCKYRETEEKCQSVCECMLGCVFLHFAKHIRESYH